MRPNPRIIGAAAVGLVMVAGSFFLSRGQEPAIATTEVVLKQPVRNFIAVEDADQNDIPDWQESLNIPTINLDEVSTSTTMTKTAELAVDLVNHSLVSGPVDPTAALSMIGTKLAADNLDRQYTRDDIVMSMDNSPAALRNYGNKVASIAFEHAPPTGTENEMTILNRAYLRNDPAVLEGLDPTIASYEGMLNSMLATPVPSSLVKEHLSLVNVYEAILNDIRAFRGAFTDALPVLVRLRRYPADTDALYLAVSNLYLKLDQSGIKWGESDIASKFIAIE